MACQVVLGTRQGTRGSQKTRLGGCLLSDSACCPDEGYPQKSSQNQVVRGSQLVVGLGRGVCPYLGTHFDSPLQPMCGQYSDLSEI